MNSSHFIDTERLLSHADYLATCLASVRLSSYPIPLRSILILSSHVFHLFSSNLFYQIYYGNHKKPRSSLEV